MNSELAAASVDSDIWSKPFTCSKNPDHGIFPWCWNSWKQWNGYL